MAWDWYGKMKLLAGVGKYQPYWTDPCGGSDVDGKMELSEGKYKPLPDANGVCTADQLSALPRYMYLDETKGKYKPHVVLNDQYMCCAGDDCGYCDYVGDAGLWEAGETPYQVNAAISGITQCPGQCAASYTDFNGNYTLTQDAAASCYWFYLDLDSDPCVYMMWAVYWFAVAAPISHFSIWTVSQDQTDVDAYYRSDKNECVASFDTGFGIGACCSGNVNWGITGYHPLGEIVAYGGDVEVTWPV